MIHRLLLTLALAIAPLSPAFAAVDPETGLDEEDMGTQAPTGLPDAAQLKDMKPDGQGLQLSGTGLNDIGSAMRLIKIGNALKARKPVATEDLQFLRAYLKKMNMGDPNAAGTLQKLDQVLEKLQNRTT